MSVILEQMLEDMNLLCEHCSGDVLLVITDNGELVCLACANGQKRKCDD